MDGPRAVELFAAARVEPVFTAHPTESTRRIILEKQERIANELIASLDPERTPHEARVSLARIRENITTAWQTEEHPSARPTVADEREHVLYYVTHVLYRVLPALHERLDEALAELGVEEPTERSALIRPGSWVGGDMDGNPNVDAQTIRETLRRHRDLALGAYSDEVRSLARDLTQSDSRISWSAAVSARLEHYAARFPDVAAAVPARHAGMGYRMLLDFVAARIAASVSDDARGYAGPGELLHDIEVIADSLRAHRGEHAGLFGVRRLVRRIRTFGFHMAALDVRQDARELRDVVAELLADEPWPERPTAERAARLRRLLIGSDASAELAAVRDRAAGGSERVRTALAVFDAIADGRARYGPDAIGSYIISMAQGVDDVLTVLWLATLSGDGRRGGAAARRDASLRDGA